MDISQAIENTVNEIDVSQLFVGVDENDTPIVDPALLSMITGADDSDITLEPEFILPGTIISANRQTNRKKGSTRQKVLKDYPRKVNFLFHSL